MHSDTMFANTVSRIGNMCVQISITDFECLCSFSMKLKNESHDLPALLFQWVGMPPTIICSNAKEMIQGEFDKKAYRGFMPLAADLAIHPMVECSRKGIKGLKRVLRTIKSKAPKRL